MARQRDTPVVTIFSDLPRSDRLAYAGVDPYSAGRTAGYFMAKMAPRAGSVAILGSCSRVHGHEQRRRGFADALKTYGSELVVADVIEGDDDSVKSEILLRHTLADRPDLVGIYNVGAANDAVGNWLRRCFDRQRPIFIGHELTHETRPMLRDGTMALVIDQNPEQQARFAVEVLLHHFGHERARRLTTPYKSDVSFRLFTPENIADAGDLPAPLIESHQFAAFGADASR
jgi:LacI family transcriptional regulator